MTAGDWEEFFNSPAVRGTVIVQALNGMLDVPVFTLFVVMILVLVSKMEEFL